MRVLVVSRRRSSTDWLEGVLRSAGLSVVVLEEVSPSSPELAGAELVVGDREALRGIGEAGPERRLLLVPRGQAVDLAAAMEGGFMDLLVVPAPEDEVLGKVGRALDHFLKPARTASLDRDQMREFKEIVERVTEALRSSGPGMKRTAHDLAEGMLSVFVLVIDSYESTDRGTPGHSRRVAVLTRELARRMAFEDDRVAWMELAGRLHDIGLVPLALPLSGEAPLSRELRRGLESHAKIGAEILRPLKSWGLPVDGIRDHHERIDGSGYPKGISGENLSIEAQLLGAADVFEALTSPRPWRPAETVDGALEAIRTAPGFSEPVLEALTEVATADLGPPGPLPSPPDG